jgi:hypothetical protein
MEKIPVYVYDQSKGGWLYADSAQASSDGWIEVDSPPTDVREIAGIGTRDLSPEGAEAIKNYVASLDQGVVIHSGGAVGSDTAFESAHSANGGKVVAHSFQGHSTSSKSPLIHTPEELQLAADKMAELSRSLGKNPPSKAYVANLLNRNVFQVLPGIAEGAARQLSAADREPASFTSTDPSEFAADNQFGEAKRSLGSSAPAEGATSPAIDQGVVQTPPAGETPASVAPRAISVGSAPGDQVPEKMTTAATPDLQAAMEATQTGEMRTPISAMPSVEANQAARAESILGYDPIASLDAMHRGRNMSDTQKSVQKNLLTDIVDYMNQAGIYTTTRIEKVVKEIADSKLIFDEETNTYEVADNRKMQTLLDDVNKLHAHSMTEFINKPHGLDRKVYQTYIDHIFGKEMKPGKRVSAKDIDADGGVIERGRKAVRRYALHFLMNRIPGTDQETWREARGEFRKAMVDAGVPEDVFDSALGVNLYGQKDQRSMLNDRAAVEAATTDLRRAAGSLLREGVLYDVAGHQDVAQPIYYMLQEIANADAEILSGEASNINPFAEEDYVRSEAADITEVQEEIDRIRSEFGIEEAPTREIGGALGRSKDGTVGQEFTLRDIRNYKKGGQRRYALDVAGVIDPRWVEVDERGLDLEIFANDNHPDGTRSSASIGFNVSTDPTARIYKSESLGERSSTLEIRATKAIKEFISDRDFGSRLHPTSSDKTIRLATEIPYTRDKFRVADIANKLRGAVSSGKIVIVAFPQFREDGSKLPPGNVDLKPVVVDGRVFLSKPGEMIALEEGDSAIPKLVSEGWKTTKPFRIGDAVEYPALQTKPGQFNKFVVDVDPIVHQAVQHELPLRTTGGYEYQGAYVPESFADSYQGRTQVVVEQGPGGRARTPGIRPIMRETADPATGQLVETPALVMAKPSPEIRTLIIADDRGNFPTVGTMIDGYVFGDPYGEDPRMYAEIADRSGPSMKSLVSQRRKYEEMIEAGTPRSQLVEPSEENMSLLEENIGPRGGGSGILNNDIVGQTTAAGSPERYEGSDVYESMRRPGTSASTTMLAAAEGSYESQVAEYNKYLALKKEVDENPTDTQKADYLKRRYPEGMKEPKSPKAEKFRDVLEGPRVAVYDATDVYDRAAKKPGRRKQTAKLSGTIVDLPPVLRSDLSPAHRQQVDTMLRSLLIILRNRAQTANFINAGGLNGDTGTIRMTQEPIAKLFQNLDQNGLYNDYFNSILHEDVFSTRLGLDNPDASVWLQKLVEYPGQRPLSTRGRSSERFLPRSVLTGDTDSDSFNDAVDAIYESVADFHAQNPARLRGEVSFESVQENIDQDIVDSEDARPADQKTVMVGGQEVTLSPEQMLAERTGPEYSAIQAVAKKLDKNRALIASMIADPEFQQYSNGDIYAMSEIAPPAGYDGGQPWGDFVMKNVDDVVRMIREAGTATKRKGTAAPVAEVERSRTVAIKQAVSRLASLPKEDWQRAVDTAFEKYSRHLSEDLDGDSMVKVINSVLYGDQQDNALAAFIDEYQYHDITDRLGMEVLPDLQGKTSRIITKDEILATSKNKSTARKLASFVKKNGFDFIVTKSEVDGTRVLITKVEKDKWGNIDVAEESRFSRRNLFTAEEVMRVLGNFGSTGLMNVQDSGLRDGNSPLLKISLNPDAMDYVADQSQNYVDENTGKLTTTLRNLLDSGMKAEFRSLVNEEAQRSGVGTIFEASDLNALSIWKSGTTEGFYGPFGQRRVRNQGTQAWWAVRRGGLDAAERLAALAKGVDSVKPGADPILDALREQGDTRAKYMPLDKETEGLSRTAKSYIRNHKMKLIGGGGLLGAIAMGVGVDAALNKAEYGDQAAADMLPTSVAMNAAFEASPLLGSALALSHSAVNKQDMMRTLVNILGSLAGGAAGGALGAFAGGVGAFATGMAGSVAGAGLTNSIYNAVTGQTDYDTQQMPANVAVDEGNSAGASSTRARVMPAVTRNSTAMDQIRQLENLGG